MAWTYRCNVNGNRVSSACGRQGIRASSRSLPGVTTVPDTGCCIITVAEGRQVGAVIGVPADSAQDCLREVQQAVRRRRGPTSALAHDLWSLARRFGLPGIAVVWERGARAGTEIPAPIAVPFEPTALDERGGALGALCAATLTGAPSGRRDPVPSGVGRRIVRIGLLVATVVGAGVYVVLDAVGPAASVLGNVLLAAAGLLVALGMVIVWHLRGGQWFIVPGGVVVRRFSFDAFGTVKAHYTPRNSVLIATRDIAGWNVGVHQGWHCVKRSVTDLEATALLAAWRTTTPLPPMDEVLA
jgi:hypothetical protein